MWRTHTPLAAVLALNLASCGESGDLPMTIGDPLHLIEEVEGPLRLYVLPREDFTCDASTGAVAPDVPDVPEGMFSEAIADVTLDVTGSQAATTLEVSGGSYVILVRGKGTDPVSMRPHQIIARACANASIEAGETREVRLSLLPVVGMGECGDGITSPDEQCEDGNTVAGDGCSDTCRSEPFTINTTTGGALENPASAAGIGQRWVFSYLTRRTDTLLRLLEPDRSAVTRPGVLMNDASLGSAFPSGADRPLEADVAVGPGGRIAVAFVDYTAGADAKLGFFNQNRTPEGDPALVRDGTTGAIQVAFAGDGATMVVFEDADSATGLSGQVFAAGSITSATDEPFEVGQGTSGGSAPAVAGGSDHFIVAFTAGGSVYHQRFETNGVPRDDESTAVDEGTMQDQVAVGVLSDDRTLFAWRQRGAAGDGDGSAIAARAFEATGEPTGPTFLVNTNTTGDQSDPTVVAHEGTFGVAFGSGAGVRARVLASDGEGRPNREQPLSTSDFEVAPTGVHPDSALGGTDEAPRWMVVWSENGDIRGRVFPLP